MPKRICREIRKNDQPYQGRFNIVEGSDRTKVRLVAEEINWQGGDNYDRKMVNFEVESSRVIIMAKEILRHFGKVEGS